MTNEELFDDLKQFMSAQISQSEARLRSELDRRFQDADEKLDEILNVVGKHDQAVDSQLADHAERIGQLEQRAA